MLGIEIVSVLESSANALDPTAKEAVCPAVLLSKPRQVLKSHSFPVLALMRTSPSVVAALGGSGGLGGLGAC